jgi:NADH:ubiquinone oxidoreductase subunit 4 (subunit M)
MISTLDSSMLTLVTFIPLAGALLLLLFPRRDRDIRLFALVVSLLDFVLSLHLPVHFQRGQAGFQYEVNNQWRGWRFHVAGGADHFPYTTLRSHLLEIDS